MQRQTLKATHAATDPAAQPAQSIKRLMLARFHLVKLRHMETLFAVLHVVAAVFIVGPMAILPMTAMRAVRSGSASQVATLAKSTTIFTWLSILVVIFGFGVMGMSEWDISITTPWILWSLILWAVAAVLTMTVVVPSMKKAASALESGDSSGARYPAIAAGSGLASILLVIVVILMVWKP